MHVEIGESGIVTTVINVLMEYPCHVSTAVVPRAHSPNKWVELTRGLLVLLEFCGKSYTGGFYQIL